MINVEIFVSPEGNDHRFLINDEPLDPQIDIANHVHQPFGAWKASIFQELAEMCNDYFSVVFHCTNAQFGDLKPYADSCSLCRDCTQAVIAGADRDAPSDETSDTAAGANTDESYSFAVRRLEQMEAGGAAGPVKKLEFGFYIAADREDRRNELFECFAANGFTRTLTKKIPYFAIALEEIQSDETEYFENDYFAFAAAPAAGTSPVFTADSAEAFVGGILEYAARKCLIPFISANRSAQNAGRHRQESHRDKYSISLPERMFVGDRVPLRILGAEYEDIKDELEFVPDKQGVIRFIGGQLSAVSAGTVNICFRVKGSLDSDIVSGRITVAEHVLVREITVSDYPDTMYVGDSFYLDAACVPVYAENAGELKIIAADASVLSVSSFGKITAEGAGSGRIDIIVGDIRKTIEIVIKEHLNHIILPRNEVIGYIGTCVPFKIAVEPAEYTEEDIVVVSDDPSVASYQNGEIAIHNIGSSDITFCAKDSDVQATVHVEGQSTFMKKNYRDIPVQIGIVLFLVTAVAAFFGRNLFFVSVPGAVLCIVSLFLDRKSRLFAIIFALLNIAVSYFLIAGIR